MDSLAQQEGGDEWIADLAACCSLAAIHGFLRSVERMHDTMCRAGRSGATAAAVQSEDDEVAAASRAGDEAFDVAIWPALAAGLYQ